MNWLDKLRGKTGKTVFSGTGEEYKTWYREYFKDKHGEGKTGLDYAKDYEYNPNVVEKFLDKVPGISGKRAYDRAFDYGSKVHFNPEYSEASEDMMRRGVHVTGKSMGNYQEINDRMTDNRFTWGSTVVATEDPRVFGHQMITESDDTVHTESNIQGGVAGHYAEDGWNSRAIDPYNIATATPGSKFLGLFPRGYKGKITSNVAEGGGSKINPYINPETLKKQVMGNKNLAIADEDFYADKKTWDVKKDFNKAAEASSKRWKGYAK